MDQLRPPEIPREHTEGREPQSKAVEVATAVVLSIAGLLTSWASFQSLLWEGRQSAHYSRANIIRTEASTAELQGNARQAIDVNLFSAWLQARMSGKDRLADFYSTRFPPELRTAFDAWMKTDPLQNPNAPPSPFHGGGVRPPGLDRARELGEQAAREFDAGLQSNRRADDFAQATVFFAITLFFGGIAQVFRFRAARMGLLAVAVAACIVAVIRVVGLPMIRPA
jgi:hypothetical protein